MATTKTHHSTNPTAHAHSHGSPTSGAHRSPSAGALRPRGSSKRNQIQKARKNHLETNDPLKEELAASGSTVEKRLAAAIRTKRLDLSLPRQNLAPPEPPVLHIFPAVVVDHVKLGHLLTELWLTNHHIGALPAEIAVFTKLRVLGFAGNALTALPAELCQLTALEALYLENNRLQTLPSKVAFPPQLRELRLNHNQLAVFPAQVTRLRLLNRLGLSHNQLKVLPEEIHRLRNLVELKLDYNRLDADFPSGFGGLQRLERLGLEGNFLAERPKVLDRLPALSYIRLSGNRAKLAVPKRHDGYFQCVERDAVAEDTKTELRNLEGLVPCRDQNLLNITGYENRRITNRALQLDPGQSGNDEVTLVQSITQSRKQVNFTHEFWLWLRPGPVISIFSSSDLPCDGQTNQVMAQYESMAPSPQAQQSKTQANDDSRVDTTVDIPDECDPVASQSSWSQLGRNYRALEFACTLCLYPLAYLFASIDVYERPIPGIRVRLNSTAEVWALDPVINETKLAQEVPMWLLVALGVVLPVRANLVVNYALPAFCQVRVIAHDTRDFLLSLFQSAALAMFLTQFIKNITGRFRPCFYSMRQWNHDVVWDGVTNLCTSSSGEKEGRKSFPSGHASFAWSTMLVLTLYLLGRSRLHCANHSMSMMRGGKKTLAMFLCCLPLLLAVWICVTRSIDNWHHYSDILAGSVIGIAAAIFAVASHYGSIFSWEDAGLPHETIHERLERSQR